MTHHYILVLAIWQEQDFAFSSSFFALPLNLRFASTRPMFHPVLWPKPTFFYPVRNIPAVDFTRGLPRREIPLALLLGCGDARSILYPAFVSQSTTRDFSFMDFTWCDIQPGVLARNTLVLSLIADECPTDQIWNITCHYNLDSASYSLLVSQCEKFVGHTKSWDDWKKSLYAKFIRFCTRHTLSEHSCYWYFYTSGKTSSSDTKS
jgi:hypothetical protein